LSVITCDQQLALSTSGFPFVKRNTKCCHESGSRPRLFVPRDDDDHKSARLGHGTTCRFRFGLLKFGPWPNTPRASRRQRPLSSPRMGSLLFVGFRTCRERIGSCYVTCRSSCESARAILLPVTVRILRDVCASRAKPPVVQCLAAVTENSTPARSSYVRDHE
jgi:hypothetical protein